MPFPLIPLIAGGARTLATTGARSLGTPVRNVTQQAAPVARQAVNPQTVSATAQNTQRAGFLTRNQNNISNFLDAGNLAASALPPGQPQPAPAQSGQPPPSQNGQQPPR
jgi:hypothetical protein